MYNAQLHFDTDCNKKEAKQGKVPFRFRKYKCQAINHCCCSCMNVPGEAENEKLRSPRDGPYTQSYTRSSRTAPFAIWKRAAQKFDYTAAGWESTRARGCDGGGRRRASERKWGRVFWLVGPSGNRREIGYYYPRVVKQLRLPLSLTRASPIILVSQETPSIRPAPIEISTPVVCARRKRSRSERLWIWKLDNACVDLYFDTLNTCFDS